MQDQETASGQVQILDMAMVNWLAKEWQTRLLCIISLWKQKAERP